MTETVVDAGFDGQALFQTLAGKPMRTVAVQARGAEALVEANATLGLALSDDEIEYLAKSFQRPGARPHRRRADDVRPGQQRALPPQDLQRPVGDRRPGTAQHAVRHDPRHPQGAARRHRSPIPTMPPSWKAAGPALPGRRARPAGRGGRGRRPGPLYPPRHHRAHADEGGNAQSPDRHRAVPRRVHRRGRRDPRRRRDRPRLQARPA